MRENLALSTGLVLGSTSPNEISRGMKEFHKEVSLVVTEFLAKIAKLLQAAFFNEIESECLQQTLKRKRLLSSTQT